VFDLREVVGQKIRPTTAADEKLCGFRSCVCGCVFDLREVVGQKIRPTTAADEK
jgi:hypothetical protein